MGGQYVQCFGMVWYGMVWYSSTHSKKKYSRHAISYSTIACTTFLPVFYFVVWVTKADEKIELHHI